MAITKDSLAENLVYSIGVNKREAVELVEIFFDELRDTLKDGKEIKLSSFGNFYLADKKTRIGRNPKTGEKYPIAARRVVTFRTGPTLKAKVEKYAGPARNS
jgi:integration host factor subunit alpha